MSDHYHCDYASTHHDHRGQYADDRHDHGLDYAERHHRHYDDEGTARGLREDLGAAEARIRELEEDRDAIRRQLAAMLEQIRVLVWLRQSCVICHDATADRQTVTGPACVDCAGDLPDEGPDPERPETWAFTEPEEYDPGREIDDEGGMSEYRYAPPEDCQRGRS